MVQLVPLEMPLVMVTGDGATGAVGDATGDGATGARFPIAFC